MSLTKEQDKKYHEYRLAEGEWVDSVFQSLYPKLAPFIKNRLNPGKLQLALQFILVNIIARRKKIHIKRSQDTVLLEHGRGYVIKAINTRLCRGEDVLASKKFQLGLIIKENQ